MKHTFLPALLFSASLLSAAAQDAFSLRYSVASLENLEKAYNGYLAAIVEGTEFQGKTDFALVETAQNLFESAGVNAFAGAQSKINPALSFGAVVTFPTKLCLDEFEGLALKDLPFVATLPLANVSAEMLQQRCELTESIVPGAPGKCYTVKLDEENQIYVCLAENYVAVASQEAMLSAEKIAETQSTSKNQNTIANISVQAEAGAPAVFEHFRNKLEKQRAELIADGEERTVEEDLTAEEALCVRSGYNSRNSVSAIDSCLQICRLYEMFSAFSEKIVVSPDKEFLHFIVSARAKPGTALQKAFADTAAMPETIRFSYPENAMIYGEQFSCANPFQREFSAANFKNAFEAIELLLEGSNLPEAIRTACKDLLAAVSKAAGADFHATSYVATDAQKRLFMRVQAEYKDPTLAAELIRPLHQMLAQVDSPYLKELTAANSETVIDLRFKPKENSLLRTKCNPTEENLALLSGVLGEEVQLRCKNEPAGTLESYFGTPNATIAEKDQTAFFAETAHVLTETYGPAKACGAFLVDFRPAMQLFVDTLIRSPELMSAREEILSPCKEALALPAAENKAFTLLSNVTTENAYSCLSFPAKQLRLLIPFAKDKLSEFFTDAEDEGKEALFD